MTFHPTSFPQQVLNLSQLWPDCMKHRDDYAEVVAKIGADVLGTLECASTAMSITQADDESWCRAWFTVGESSMKKARDAAERGHLQDARDNWRRASIYFGAAELYLPSSDARHRPIVEKMRACARNYIATFARNGQVVRIPSVGTQASEGYLAYGADADMPIIICLAGWGEWKEGNIPLIEAALARGAGVLLVEAPQLAASQATGFGRFACTAFVSACVDFLNEHVDLKHRSVAIYGTGAGAMLAVQAAQYDDRIVTVVNDAERGEGDDMAAMVRWFIGSARGDAAQETPPLVPRQVRCSYDKRPNASVGVLDWIAMKSVAGLVTPRL